MTASKNNLLSSGKFEQEEQPSYLKKLFQGFCNPQNESTDDDGDDDDDENAHYQHDGLVVIMENVAYDPSTVEESVEIVKQESADGHVGEDDIPSLTDDEGPIVSTSASASTSVETSTITSTTVYRAFFEPPKETPITEDDQEGNTPKYAAASAAEEETIDQVVPGDRRKLKSVSSSSATSAPSFIGGGNAATLVIKKKKQWMVAVFTSALVLLCVVLLTKGVCKVSLEFVPSAVVGVDFNPQAMTPMIMEVISSDENYSKSVEEEASISISKSESVTAEHVTSASVESHCETSTSNADAPSQSSALVEGDATHMINSNSEHDEQNLTVDEYSNEIKGDVYPEDSPAEELANNSELKDDGLEENATFQELEERTKETEVDSYQRIEASESPIEDVKADEVAARYANNNKKASPEDTVIAQMLEAPKEKSEEAASEGDIQANKVESTDSEDKSSFEEDTFDVAEQKDNVKSIAEDSAAIDVQAEAGAKESSETREEGATVATADLHDDWEEASEDEDSPQQQHKNPVGVENESLEETTRDLENAEADGTGYKPVGQDETQSETGILIHREDTFISDRADNAELLHVGDHPIAEATKDTSVADTAPGEASSDADGDNNPLEEEDPVDDLQTSATPSSIYLLYGASFFILIFAAVVWNGTLTTNKKLLPSATKSVNTNAGSASVTHSRKEQRKAKKRARRRKGQKAPGC